MNKIKVIFSSIIVIAFAAFGPALLSTGVVSAAYDPPGKSACSGSQGDPISNPTNCAANANGKDLPTIIGTILNIFSWVVGAVAVIMVIYGGFRYVTSGGDQNGVKSAKDTLLYAVIGLVIVALSQVIVNFVLKSANTASGVQ